MPLPLIPLAVAGAAAVVGAVVTVMRPKIAGMMVTKVAILGGPQAGKTTLLHRLQDESSAAEAAAGASPNTQFQIGVDDKSVVFVVENDVPSDAKARFTHWKDAYDGADVVWYLFRADLISAGDPGEIQLVRGHLDMLKDWSDLAGRKAPRTVLVGTWADQDPLFGSDPDKYAKRIQSAEPIKLGRRKFKKHAAVVVGSLAAGSSAQIIEDLARALV